MGLWSELPRDLLDEIVHLLVLYIDKIRVAVSLCTSWNLHLPKTSNHQVRRLPWLLQSFENDTEASYGLFDLSEKKFYKLDLPEAQGKLFKGSSYGWVVTIGDDMHSRSISSSSADINLINPLTRAQIQLPPRYTFADVSSYVADRVGEEYAVWNPPFVRPGSFRYVAAEFVNSSWMHKVVLSSAPSREDCLVVAIYGECGHLAWCKCNDKEWKPLSKPGTPSYDDILFYNGKLHALNCHGALLVFENICPNPKVKEIAKLPNSIVNYSDILYLVESTDGGLVMVMRFVKGLDEEDSLTERTEMFKVYKLDSINSSWVQVKDIGDDILFLGLNSSFSISSRDFEGYKGNSIYYTDHWLTAFSTKKEKREKHACSDIGVFNLKDGSFESLPDFKCNPKFVWPPPVWVMPLDYY